MRDESSRAFENRHRNEGWDAAGSPRFIRLGSDFFLDLETGNVVAF